MSSPKITVLMSTYNGEKYLCKSIDSILNQTFTDFEFLIIDDGSTDKTLEILQDYNDSRIRIITNKKNIGLTGSLNEGLKIANGKHIARQDADDISHPERLEKQYYFLENNKEYGLVGSWTEVIDENNNHIQYWKQESEPELIFYILSFRNCLTHTSVMFDRKFVNEIKGYNEKYERSQDYELWYRISRKKKIYVIPEYLVKWRRVSEGVSIKCNTEQKYYAKRVPLENLRISENLLDYLLNISGKKSFLEKIKLFRELYKFHINIQNEGENINLDRKKLKSICNKKMLNFIKSNFINVRVVNLVKKILKFKSLILFRRIISFLE